MEAEKAARAATSAKTAGTIVLATVKGDVHDIGKNIVGVVLACNNYEIIDLGVMTPASKILAVARRRPTPSACPASSRRRSTRWFTSPRRWSAEGFDIPLLIGGATTSRVHTAVKSSTPAIPAVRRCMSMTRAVQSASFPRCSRRRLAQRRSSRCAPSTARWRRRTSAARPTRSAFRLRKRAPTRSRPIGRLSPNDADLLGPRAYEWNDLADLARYIDWTPFFQTWELKGRYPRSSTTRIRERPRALFVDAQAMLKRIIDEKWFTPKAVVGFWPAAQVGDDIRLFADNSRATPIANCFDASPAARSPRWAAQRRARGFRRAGFKRPPRLCRRLRCYRGYRG